jgi:hypothetical protein
MKTDSTELYSKTNLVDYVGEHTQRGLASEQECVCVRARNHQQRVRAQ